MRAAITFLVLCLTSMSGCAEEVTGVNNAPGYLSSGIGTVAETATVEPEIHQSSMDLSSSQGDVRLEACTLILGSNVPLKECLEKTLPEFYEFIVDHRSCDVFFLPSYGIKKLKRTWTDDDYSILAQVLLINKDVFSGDGVGIEEVWEMKFPRATSHTCKSTMI